MKVFKCLLTAALLGSLTAPGWAQDEEAEAAAVKPRPIYIPLKPPLVVNYGGKGRLKYLRAELSVRVSSAGVANSVRHHMPFIRNNLVLLFSRQMDEDIDTQEGKELLRLAALEEIRSVLDSEEGGEEDGKEGGEEGDSDSGVVDLYFNNFVIQK